jgi:hypothetical protein
MNLRILVPVELCEPIRRKRSVARRRLQIAVADRVSWPTFRRWRLGEGAAQTVWKSKGMGLHNSDYSNAKLMRSQKSGPDMFTVIASVAVLAITYWTDRLSDKEAVQRSMVFDDDIVRQNVIFARRDLRLIAWMLAAMLVMLGIIADRIHH